MAGLPAITNYSNLFHLMMDEDNAFLTHREQLILALAIVHSRKDKVAGMLFSRYRSILEPQNMKSVKKISACLALSAILEKSKAAARLSIVTSSGKQQQTTTVVNIKLVPGRQFLPFALLASALKNFEGAFNVSVACQVVAATGSKQHEATRVIA